MIRRSLGISGLLLGVGATLLLPGCAARFAGHDLPSVEQLPAPAADVSPVASYWLQAPQESLFREVLLESGRFTTVFSNDGIGEVEADTDLHLDLQLMHRSRTRSATRVLLHQIVCGLTLTAIPYWGTDATQLVARVSRRDGRKKEYVIEEKMTLIAWLPMLAVRLPQMAFEPFIGSVEDRFYRKLFRNLLLRMAQDGFLDGPARG